MKWSWNPTQIADGRAMKSKTEPVQMHRWRLGCAQVNKLKVPKSDSCHCCPTDFHFVNNDFYHIYFMLFAWFNNYKYANTYKAQTSTKCHKKKPAVAPFASIPSLMSTCMFSVCLMLSELTSIIKHKSVSSCSF